MEALAAYLLYRMNMLNPICKLFQNSVLKADLLGTCWVFDHLNRFFLFYFSACLSSRAPTWVGTYRRLAGIFAIVGTAYGHDQEWW